jgi:hypothetical protein
MSRSLDLDALDRYNKLRNENRAIIENARVVEKQDIGRAAEMYMQAIEATQSYAFITFEKGLFGRLLMEVASEYGHTGELVALDRLTMCLIKLGRAEEDATFVESYFALYRRDRDTVASEAIAKRVSKALARRR